MPDTGGHKTKDKDMGWGYSGQLSLFHEDCPGRHVWSADGWMCKITSSVNIKVVE